MEFRKEVVNTLSWDDYCGRLIHEISFLLVSLYGGKLHHRFRVVYLIGGERERCRIYLLLGLVRNLVTGFYFLPFLFLPFIWWG